MNKSEQQLKAVQEAMSAAKLQLNAALQAYDLANSLTNSENVNIDKDVNINELELHKMQLNKIMEKAKAGKSVDKDISVFAQKITQKYKQ